MENVTNLGLIALQNLLHRHQNKPTRLYRELILKTSKNQTGCKIFISPIKTIKMLEISICKSDSRGMVDKRMRRGNYTKF